MPQTWQIRTMATLRVSRTFLDFQERENLAPDKTHLSKKMEWK
jgi:hypothetical protein